MEGGSGHPDRSLCGLSSPRCGDSVWSRWAASHMARTSRALSMGGLSDAALVFKPYRRMLPGIKPLRGPCWREITETLPITNGSVAFSCSPAFPQAPACMKRFVMVCVYSGPDGRYFRRTNRQALLAQSQGRVALLQEASPGTRVYLALPAPGNQLRARAENLPPRGSPALRVV